VILLDVLRTRLLVVVLLLKIFAEPPVERANDEELVPFRGFLVVTSPDTV